MNVPPSRTTVGLAAAETVGADSSVGIWMTIGPVALPDPEPAEPGPAEPGPAEPGPVGAAEPAEPDPEPGSGCANAFGVAITIKKQTSANERSPVREREWEREWEREREREWEREWKRPECALGIRIARCPLPVARRPFLI